MQKLIFTLLLLVITTFSYAEKNSQISASLGYPFELTEHYYIHKWKSGANLNLNYQRGYKSFFFYGAGISYTYSLFDCGINNIKQEENIQEISPYIIVSKKRLFDSFINLSFEGGISFLSSSDKSFEEKDFSFYLAPEISFEHSMNKNLSVFINSSYKIIFNDIEFETGMIPANIMTLVNDDFISYITFGIGFTYNF